MHDYHVALILPVNFHRLYGAPILGKLGIGPTFTIYVMLAVTNSKHKLQSYVTMVCICIFFRLSVSADPCT
jgi:hypothetical protein